MAPPVRRRRDGPTARPSTEVASVLAGRTLVRGRLEAVEIAIDGEGKIHSVGRTRPGGPRRDVGEAVILPAATDLHVHFREPGGPADAETIPTGTIGAALGGITLVGDMPNTEPPIVDADGVADKAARVRGRAAIDLLLYASPTQPRALERLARVAGAFKLYLGPTTGIGDPPPAEEVPPLLRRLAGIDLPLTVHAEDPRQFRSDRRPHDPVGWNDVRPLAAEAAALDLLATAPDGLRLHVAHLTGVGSAERLRAAGRSFEVTPMHLLLSDRSGSDARFKVNPPLRAESERRSLWDAFRRGEVPCLASDHAPHPLAAKERPFDRAPSGMPGVETMVPLLLARVRAGELSLDVLVRAACDRPARWLGQPLGRIAPGHRANLMVVDFRAREPLTAKTLHAPCGWTPYEGWEAIRPREVWKDGEPIVRDGEYVGRPSGEVVRPEYAPGRGRG